MADTDDNAAPDTPAPQTDGEGAQAQPAAEAPQIRIAAQYIKDLSFENPGARALLQPSTEQPSIEVQVNVQAARGTQDGIFEVALKLSANAKRAEEAIFLCELEYAGVFQLNNIPTESLQPVLLIECPRMIFPFARRILIDAVREGGYDKFLLDPIDFAGLYRQRMNAEAQRQNEANGEAVVET